MKKSILLFAILMIASISIFAQAPQKFSYQAVVRNASNSLVTNAPVGVRVSILSGGALGNTIYSETHTTATNANGLLTIEIGSGSVQQGAFSDIEWGAGMLFLKTEIDPNGETNYTITNTQQLLSVPYALYANEAGNSFSGDYNDLSNLPQIPQIPQNVSAFNNDAGYITIDSIPDIPVVPTNVSEFNNDAGYITMDSIPTIPTIPTSISAFTNDAGYLSSYTETDPQFNAWDKDYNDLINKPEIPTIPTNVSAFTNDVGYLTSANVQEVANIPTVVSAFQNDMGYLTSYTETDPTVSMWAKAAMKPVYSYSEIMNTPNLAMVATTGNYNDLSNKPAIPTIPSNVSTFNNDAHYITEAQLNNLLASMNSIIDSLRDRIEELELHSVQPHPDTNIIAQACLGLATVTDYDLNVYNTVQIGSQCWMKENMRATHYADGTAVTQASLSQYSTTTRYYYNPGHATVYGYLYNWPAAKGLGVSAVSANNQGICPTGWHVPSNDEWTQLTQYVGSQSQYLCNNGSVLIAKALASSTGWSPSTNSCAVGNTPDSNNATGFSALPAGYYYYNSDSHYGFDSFGNLANLWSSTESGSIYAFYRFLNYTIGNVCSNTHNKSNGYSVRCLRD